MILESFPSCFHLLPKSKGKFVMFWNLSFFLKKIEKERKIHNSLLFTLNPRLKNLHLIFFISHGEGVNIVEKYDR